MESLYHYPRGLGGVALLLLRVSVGMLLAANAARDGLFTSPSVVAFVIAGLSVGLCIGIVTPVLSVSAVVGGGSLMVWAAPARSLAEVATLLLCVVISILGAGAYSIDGVLFGRRRVVF